MRGYTEKDSFVHYLFFKVYWEYFILFCIILSLKRKEKVHHLSSLLKRGGKNQFYNKAQCTEDYTNNNLRSLISYQYSLKFYCAYPQCNYSSISYTTFLFLSDDPQNIGLSLCNEDNINSVNECFSVQNIK